MYAPEISKTKYIPLFDKLLENINIDKQEESSELIQEIVSTTDVAKINLALTNARYECSGQVSQKINTIF